MGLYSQVQAWRHVHLPCLKLPPFLRVGLNISRRQVSSSYLWPIASYQLFQNLVPHTHGFQLSCSHVGAQVGGPGVCQKEHSFPSLCSRDPTPGLRNTHAAMSETPRRRAGYA